MVLPAVSKDLISMNQPLQKHSPKMATQRASSENGIMADKPPIILIPEASANSMGFAQDIGLTILIQSSNTTVRLQKVKALLQMTLLHMEFHS